MPNQGKQSNLYFWRDRSGNEIDIIIDNGQSVIPVEIKSGQTIHAGFFKHIRNWNKLAENKGGVLFYAGIEDQLRSDEIQVRSWRKIGSF